MCRNSLFATILKAASAIVLLLALPLAALAAETPLTVRLMLGDYNSRLAVQAVHAITLNIRN